MRLRKPLLAQVLLLVALLGAFGAFDYEQIVQLREIPRMCVAVLFLWLAISTRFDSRWVLYAFLPVYCLALFILLYAYVFTLRTDGPLLPSVLAQRNYVYFLLGPAVYMLHVRGWRLIDFQRVFLWAMFLTVMSLVVYDLALAPRSLLLSGRFFVVSLGEVSDQTSTFRLINTSALFLLLYFGRRFLQTKDLPLLGFMLATIGVSAMLLATTIPRSLLASVVLALILYAAFLSWPSRAKLVLLMLPIYAAIVVLLMPTLREAFVGAFGRDRTYGVRVDTTQKAWHSFLEYPLFGFGQDSAQALSYRSYFGDNFFPSDIGLLGVAFQFGFVGLALYLFLTTWLCVKLLGLLWASSHTVDPKQRAFLWTLFVLCLTFMIASPIQAKFIFGNALPIGAFSWGLIMASKRDLFGTPRTELLDSRTIVKRPVRSGPGAHY